MNESAEPSPSPDAVKEEMTVMTEPDDKQTPEYPRILPGKRRSTM